MKFVDKQLAIKLKEKGFDRPCFGWYYIENINKEVNLNEDFGTYEDCLYSNNWDDLHDIGIVDRIDAPTIEQVLEWLREKDVYIWIMPYNVYGTKNHLAFQWNVTLGKSFKSKNQFDKDTLYTHIHLDIEHWKEDYNDACIAGIEFVVNDLI